MKRSALLFVCISSSLLFGIGCTKEDSGESSSPSKSDTPAPSQSQSSFRTSCGTVFEGQQENPIDAKPGKRGSVSVLGPNLVSISLKKGSQLVKIHGLDVPFQSATQARAEAILNELAAEGDAYFYPAEPDCSATLDDGRQGMIGALFSANGKSFAETLLKKGLGQPTTDVCRGSLIASCYRALAEDAAPVATPTPEVPIPQGPSKPAGFILWKPVSDVNGRLAVHSAPYGTTVVVRGERGRNAGGGNGYGSLARFSKAGCGYGKNVRVELLLSDGSNFMFGDKDYAVIPDGCKRWTIDQKGKAAINKK